MSDRTSTGMRWHRRLRPSACGLLPNFMFRSPPEDRYAHHSHGLHGAQRPLSAILFIGGTVSGANSSAGTSAGLRRTSQRLGLPGNHCSGLPRQPRRSRGDHGNLAETSSPNCPPWLQKAGAFRQSPVNSARRCPVNLLCL